MIDVTGQNRIMKNKLSIISIIFIIILLVVFKAPEHLDFIGNAILSLQTPPKITIGSQLKLDILASGVADLAGVQLSISYNPTVLAYNRTVEGNFLNQNGSAKTLFLNTLGTSSPGILSDIAIAKIGQGVSGGGIVVSVYFDAISTGFSDLSIQNILLSDSNGNPIGAGVINTNVSVQGVILPKLQPTILQPLLKITAPTAGSVIFRPRVDVEYTKTGDISEVHHVNLQLDNSPIVKDTDLDGFYRFRSVPAGNHTIKAYLARADNSKIAGTDASVKFTTAKK